MSLSIIKNLIIIYFTMNTRFLRPEILANILLCFSMFFLTLWRFGTNQCLALAALVILVNRPWRLRLFSMEHFKRPLIIATCLFLIWATLSWTYTQAPCMSSAAHGLALYTKLLFLLILPLAMGLKSSRTWIEQGIIFGILVNVILTMLYYFHVNFVVVSIGRFYSVNGVFGINPLQMIFVVVFACWILMQRMIERKASFIDIGIFVLLSIYLWFINIERSGYLLYLVLILVALYQILNKKGIVIGFLCIPILLVGLYEFSPNVQARIKEGINNIYAYQQTEQVKNVAIDNSLGLRVAFFAESLKVIKAHPLLGTGIGSFKSVYQNMGGPSSAGINDPHNAYTLVTFELGLIGLALYLGWLAVIFHNIKLLTPKNAHRLRGLWWIFVIMGFTDSGLILNAVGLSFIIGVSLYAHEGLK